VRGEPLVVAEAISANIGYYNLASFAVSTNGVLVYDSTLVSTRLEWLDRAGKPLGRFSETGRFGYPRISSDGTQIAFTLYDTGINKDQIWIGDVARGTQTRLTAGPGENSTPAWAPDGSRLAFSSDRKHQADIYMKASSGAANDEALSDEPGQKVPEDWSRDGRFIVFFDRPVSGLRNPRLSVMPVTGERKTLVLYKDISDGLLGSAARFSPDGHWVAFTSDESGRNEVCVVSFPDAKRKIQISNTGGQSAQWRADGRELFFVGSGRRLTAVEIQPGIDLKVGTSRVLFDLPAGFQAWDVTPDGQRFLVNRSVVESNSVPLNLVVNWTARLKSR